MNCSQMQGLLADYLGNELDAERRHRAEQHLSDCPACREEVQRLQGTLAQLVRLDTVTPAEAVVQTSRLRVIRVRPLWMRLGRELLKVAAVLVVGITAGWYVRAARHEPAQPPTVARVEPAQQVHPGWIELSRRTGSMRSSFVAQLAQFAQASQM